jgi:hypothetical protein
LIKDKLDEEGRGRKEVSDTTTLRDQSSRWQKLAAVPDAEFRGDLGRP